MRTTPLPEDQSTTARIRDAAIRCFADSGIAGTTVRAIAREAEVSPGLVMHHFGSKDRLRQACDRHVARLVREAKEQAMASGAAMDPVGQLRELQDGPPLLRYLARSLADGSPGVADLVDELVADAVDYMQQGVDSGLLRPTDDARGRAAVMSLWSLGALVLHEHVQRLLGADITSATPEDLAPYTIPAAEILGHGILVPEVADRLRGELQHALEES